MPAAVWRTRPARSISLWLTICASDGLSLRTGRKALDQRMAAGSTVTPYGWQPQGDVAAPTQEAHKSNLEQFQAVTRTTGGHTPRPSERTDLGRGFGGAVERLGTFAATHPRGLTSNRHAGRPDRMSIRAFAFDKPC